MSEQLQTAHEVTPIVPTPQPLLLADAGTIAAAIHDVMGGGDEGIPWGYGFIHPFESVAVGAQMRFTDAVINRIRKLQAEPHNLGINLSNCCDRHKRLRLPPPTGSMCADCETEFQYERRHPKP